MDILTATVRSIHQRSDKYICTYIITFEHYGIVITVYFVRHTTVRSCFNKFFKLDF